MAAQIRSLLPLAGSENGGHRFRQKRKSLHRNEHSITTRAPPPHVTMSSIRTSTLRVLFVALMFVFLVGARASAEEDEEEVEWACTATCGNSTAYLAAVRYQPSAFPPVSSHA